MIRMKFDFFEKLFGGDQTAIREISASEKADEAGESVEKTRKKYESPPSVKLPKEEVLETYEKSSEKKIGYGVTSASFIELKGDGKVVFKTEDYRGERAAYLVDRFLGFNLVPPTVIRRIDGREGSAQEFISDARPAAELPFEDFHALYRGDAQSQKMIEMWLFDTMIGNTDRHGNNFLIDNDKKIYAIDNGRSFGEYGGFYGKLYQFEGLFKNRDWLMRGAKNFVDKQLPENVIIKMKKFLENTDGQEILENLLGEIFSEETAQTAIERICYVADMVVKNGIIPKDVIKNY